MSNLKDKFFSYIEAKGISKAEFERNSGLSNGYLNNFKGSMSSNKLEGVLIAYPDLNRDWLFADNEDSSVPMLKTSEPATPAPLVYGDIVLPPPIDGRLVADDAESFGRAMRQYGGELVPEYSTEFRGGDRGATLEESSLVGHWVIPNAPRGSFIITMYGRSMEPLLPSGSRLLLAPYHSFDVNYPNSIKFGEVFGIIVRGEDADEPAEAYIKIIRKHQDKELSRLFWIARSVNAELFDDFDIPIRRVAYLYRVLGCINTLWGY